MPLKEQPTASTQRVVKPSGVTQPQVLEEWMAGRLGGGVTVRLAGSGALIVSRIKPKSEPLPLFEEAILLGELRALVRAIDGQGSAGVALRNGVASVTIDSSLRTGNAVGIISKILEFPEVSEVRMLSRPKNG